MLATTWRYVATVLGLLTLLVPAVTTGSYICVHLDGTTNVEASGQRCCDAAESTQSTSTELSADPDCVGCLDLDVTWSGIQPQRHEHGKVALLCSAGVEPTRLSTSEVAPLAPRLQPPLAPVSHLAPLLV